MATKEDTSTPDALAFRTTEATSLVGDAVAPTRTLPAIRAAVGKVVLLANPSDSKASARLREELHRTHKASDVGGRLSIRAKGSDLAILVELDKAPVVRTRKG